MAFCTLSGSSSVSRGWRAPEEGKPLVEVVGDTVVEEEMDRLSVPVPAIMELLREAEMVDFPPLEVNTVRIL